jgi:hypothetical protein
MPRETLTYDSVEEAQRRLVGTIVTYDGQPVQVNDVRSHPDGILRVSFSAWPFDGREPDVRKMINSPLFKRFVTPPLGFCNYFSGRSANCFWTERVSARTQRQGLSSDTFNASALQSGDRANYSAIVASDGFREMVCGEYPTYADALARLVPNSSIAVDRNFALAKSAGSYVFLHHRREEVGIVLRETLYLRNDRQHMLESIVENPVLPDRVEVM